LGGVSLLAGPRTVISLNGVWDLAEGSMDSCPVRFDRLAPVPGLVDQAKPQFEVVGTNSTLRSAFWYHKKFRLDEKVPAVARLKVHKAAYGTAVWLNGTPVGEHAPCFTPGYFDVGNLLRGHGEFNELVIRVGATRNSLPPSIPSGWDFEKLRYLPGIYDSVELILSGTPQVLRVQAAPDINRQMVRAQVRVRNDGRPDRVRVTCRVRETRSKRSVGAKSSERVTLGAGEERDVRVEIPIADCHLWSPEDPFLYELEVDTGQDESRVRFGMREFHFDQPSGRAYLNGRPYYLRGSNVTLYRFFEDALRGDRPWRTDWVRQLHREFKGMNWNALRYCIGFPPELWYDIADEEGVLIQDEFPIWHSFEWPKELTRAELIREYTEWMQERWNHPSVVIWDAQNESVTTETGQAIQAVRWLDLSNRPWDNGWSPAQDPGDVHESHPYLFSNPDFHLSDLARTSSRPSENPTPNRGTNAIVINEYAWLWINRDGTPTTLTKTVYRNLLGPDATASQTRDLYARYTAALTEFWRGHRQVAGVLHFVGLGYSRSDGQTSDPWLDLDKLIWEPSFSQYVRDAFSPVGIMLDEWAEDLPAGAKRQARVTTINDLYESWQGEIRFRLLREKVILQETSVPCTLAALGDRPSLFEYFVPSDPGRYFMEASLVKPGTRTVSSVRTFDVLTAAQRASRYGVTVDHPTTSSSALADPAGNRQASLAVDGNRNTRWTSEDGGAQWLAVDLERPTPIARAVVVWDQAFAKSYALEVSDDGQAWREIFRTDNSDGSTDRIQFPSLETRWVRLFCRKPAQDNRYSVWEFAVFGE
jgi:beta-galactosidase